MRLIQTLICTATVISSAGAAQAQYVQSHHAVPTNPVYRVDLNKTQIVRLPSMAGSIVVGNPDIADVSVHSQDMIFVVGRGYGETNLVILDEAGNTVMDADIQVTAVTPSHGVRVFNGSTRRSFSCAPYCQPSPILGDDPGFIGQNSAAGEPTNGLTALFDMFQPTPSAQGTTTTTTSVPQTRGPFEGGQ